MQVSRFCTAKLDSKVGSGRTLVIHLGMVDLDVMTILYYAWTCSRGGQRVVGT